MHRVVVTGLGTPNALGKAGLHVCRVFRRPVRDPAHARVRGERKIPPVAITDFDARDVVPWQRCAPLDSTAMAPFVARGPVADAGPAPAAMRRASRARRRTAALAS